MQYAGRDNAYSLQGVESANKQALSHLEGVLSRLGIQKGGWFSAVTDEYTASLGDIAAYIQSADGMWFSGTYIHSWLIRIATISNMSHGGFFYRASDDLLDLYIVDMIEGVGGRKVSLVDEVKKYPGKYYWAPVQDFWIEKGLFSREACMEPALDLVGKKYGKLAICYEALFHVPVLRELAYWTNFSRLTENWKDAAPYCSMAQKLCAIVGGVDPVPGRAAQLCVPQDTYQSLLWSPIKVALYP